MINSNMFGIPEMTVTAVLYIGMNLWLNRGGGRSLPGGG